MIVCSFRGGVFWNSQFAAVMHSTIRQTQAVNLVWHDVAHWSYFLFFTSAMCCHRSCLRNNEKPSSRIFTSSSSKVKPGQTDATCMLVQHCWNTLQHVEQGWPNARNILRATLFQDVALACMLHAFGQGLTETYLAPVSAALSFLFVSDFSPEDPEDAVLHLSESLFW